MLILLGHAIVQAFETVDMHYVMCFKLYIDSDVSMCLTSLFHVLDYEMLGPTHVLLQASKGII